MAAAMCQRGNALYSAGKLSDAQQAYVSAEAIDPTEPKYPSNLSAVLYEQGDYKSCVAAILRSWKLLKATADADASTLANEPLPMKLATRLAKAKLNDRRGPVPFLACPLETEIFDFVTIYHGDIDPKSKEMRDIWSQWATYSWTPSNFNGLAHYVARKQFDSLPIFKSPPDPILELYHIGHDDILSLLDPISQGPPKFSKPTINLDKIQINDLRTLSFLIGGFSDARHLFGTLIHLADATRKLTSREKREAIHAHLTLVDIHPAMLARNLVVLDILRQISDAQDSSQRLELQVALFYLYLGPAVPDYCHQIIVNTAWSLVQVIQGNGSGIPSWIHINEHSLPLVVDVLTYWSIPLQKSTKTLLEREHESSTLPQGPETYKGFSTQRISSQSQGAIDIYDDPQLEDSLYSVVKVLLPPKALAHRHPALLALATSYKSMTPKLCKAAKQEIHQAWKPNPTFFDKFSTENPALGEDAGYPGNFEHPQNTLPTMLSFTRRFNPSVKLAHGKIAFSVVNGFFDLVNKALEYLADKIVVELVAADTTVGVSRLVKGELGSRPESFPRTFNRMYLSNVPDYTHGVLNVAVHLSSLLRTSPSPSLKSRISWNCLLNTGVFIPVTEYCFNYTLLTETNLPRFLGCRLVPTMSGTIFEDINLEALPLPLPLDKLATKAELHRWLSHLLLCTLCNGTPQPAPNRVDTPGNFVNFFHVLIHLYKVGFPGHWLGDFLYAVLSDTLVTDMSPYTGKLPIPSSEAGNRKPLRKVHLAPWKAELEIIMAHIQPILPFSVLVPEEYPSFKDIVACRAIVKPLDLDWHPLVPSWGILPSPFFKTVGLMFYKPNPRYTADEMVGQMEKMLEGTSLSPAADVQFMLSEDKVDLRSGVGEICWKMSRAWYSKMKVEGWKLVAFRTDLGVSVSEPLAANRWTTLEVV